jgi:hypothetical protein
MTGSYHAPPREAGRPAGTIGRVPLWALIVLVVFVAVATVTAFYAVGATVRLFIKLNRLGKALTPLTDSLAAGTARLSERSEATALNLARLEQSLARLQASRDRLLVLRWAFEDVLRLVRLARLAVPKR